MANDQPLLDPVAAELLTSASRAPSAHNTQPWKLRFGGSQVELWFDAGRRIDAIDPRDIDLKHTMGVVLENLVLTLRRLGFKSRYEVADRWSADEPVVVLRWELDSAPCPPEQRALEEAIPLRASSRLPYEMAPIDAGLVDALREATIRPCHLHFLRDNQAIDRVRALTAKANARQLADDPVARELYEWLRFSRRDRRWRRDGLNADCMGWKRYEAMAAQLLLHPLLLRMVRWPPLNKIVCANIDQQAPQTPTLCLLTVDSDDLCARVEAGRILQRLWLIASRWRCFTHPLSSAIETNETRGAVLEEFGLDAGRHTVNLFRLGSSQTPGRSPRLPPDEQLLGP